MKKMLAGASAERPLVVAVENCHFADPESLKLLRELAEAPPKGAFLIYTESPDSELPNQWPVGVRCLELDTLTAMETEHLVEAWVPRRSLSANRRAAIIRSIIASGSHHPGDLKKATGNALGQDVYGDTTFATPLMQIAAVLGQEFRTETLVGLLIESARKTMPLDLGPLYCEAVEAELERRAEEGIITRIGRGDHYQFLGGERDRLLGTLDEEHQRRLHSLAARALQRSSHGDHGIVYTISRRPERPRRW